MFSEQQRNFIEKLVLANKEDYPYYIAYTNTNINNVGVQDGVNFYVILSDEPITANSQYSYSISGDSVRFAVRSSNASYNYHSERVSVLPSVSSVSIDNYEFVYTNAEYTGATLQPDVISTNGVEQSHFDGFSIILLIIVVSVLFYKILLGGRGSAKL